MCEFESIIKEDNEIIKQLFNFSGCEVELKHLKELFTNNISNSKNGSNYFIDLLELYSKSRPHQQCVPKELIECVYSCFPEQKNEIQQKFKKNTRILKFIILPEEFPAEANKEQMI